MTHKVFLSYRRSDTAIHATALKLVLEQYLPDVVVFVDTGSVRPGENWPDRLRQELANSSVLIALMGDRWRFAPDGRDRLSEPDDWVRAELAHALDPANDVALLPVQFIDSSAPPSLRVESESRELPASIVSFASIQSAPLRSSSQLEDAKDIARALAGILKTQTRSSKVEYPRPNKLKSKAPIISEREFEVLKQEDDSLAGWRFSSFITQGGGNDVGTQLSKLFEFRNFKRAFSFMNEAALVSEGRPHHPVWTNKWNKVEVHLRTFDANQMVTWYDIELASQMTQIAQNVEAAKKPLWPYNLK